MNSRNWCCGLICLTAICANWPAQAGSTTLSSHATTVHFRYDAARHICVDPLTGKSGFNTADRNVLFDKHNSDRTVFGPADAECVDFAGFDFNASIGLGNAELRDWNLRGAKLTGAKLHFASLVNADLSGADLRGFHIGYVNISGRADAYTLPGRCHVQTDMTIDCHI